jgi:drug/metabolite transporter (DMT)-like permease
MAAETVAVLLALGAAISWGFSSVYVRLAQQHMPTSVGTLVSLVFGVVFAATLVLVFDRGSIAGLRLQDALVFGLIGIFNFPFGRYMNYLSIRYLGIGKSTPLLASVPVFAAFLAIVFFGERATLANVAGTALVLAGIYVTLKAPAGPAGGGG